MLLHFKTPLFENGNLLKKEALDILRDYPREINQFLYGDYGDGILCGFQIKCDADGIIILPGIWKYHDIFYIQRETVHLHCSTFSKETVILLRMIGSKCDMDFDMMGYEIVLQEPSLISKPQELELGRFRLEPGAILRTQYTDLLDIETEYNTVDITHVPYSANGGQTLHPVITKLYGSRMIRKQNPELDKAFSLMCLNGEAIGRNALLAYITSFQENISSQALVKEMYTALCSRYRELILDDEGHRDAQTKRGRRITVE